MQGKKGLVQILSNAETLAGAAADLVVAAAQQAIRNRGRFVVALSGGSSPNRLYGKLREAPWRENMPWEQTHVFWGDERCVPADDPRYNARAALDLLLNHVPMPIDQIHPIFCESSPAEAARAYESAIKDFFGDQAPSFDLILLGLGSDGHTASLFPGNPVLDERERLVKEVYVPEQNMHRVSFTAPLINQAEKIVFLVYGTAKSQALREVLDGPYEPRRLPAQLIRPVHGELIWLVDREAASVPAPPSTPEA